MAPQPLVAAPDLGHLPALAVGQQTIDFLPRVDGRLHLLALQIEHGPRGGTNRVPVPFFAGVKPVQASLRLPALLHQAEVAPGQFSLQRVDFFGLLRREVGQQPEHPGVIHAMPPHAESHHSGPPAIPRMRAVSTIATIHFPGAHAAPAMPRPVARAHRAVSPCQPSCHDDKHQPQGDPEPTLPIHRHSLRLCGEEIRFIPFPCLPAAIGCPGMHGYWVRSCFFFWNSCSSISPRA